MRDIKGYKTFLKIQQINKGMSSDKKYFIETTGGWRLLLRISDISEYERKHAEFEIMKKAVMLGIPMPQFLILLKAIAVYLKIVRNAATTATITKEI